MNKRYALTAFVMLVLAALACNRTVLTPTPQERTLASPSPTVPSDTPLPGVTPSPGTVTPTQGTPECVYGVSFVADVTIPDDTELAYGTDFVKIWRVRNNGTCAWEPGTTWVFESGDQMGGPDSVIVPLTEPGNTADISVHLAAPVTPDTYTGYWEMRRPNGEAFGTLIFVRIVVIGGTATVAPTGGATPTASPTASPTATSEPGVGPTITYFRADVEEADPGDTITLEWKTEGAAGVTLYHLVPTGQLGSFWEVETSGSFVYEIDPDERNSTRFVLFANDGEGHIVQATLSILLRCPDTWFFTPAPDSCPASPAIVSDAAEEHFEHGTMIWVGEQDLIYVLFDDAQEPKWSAYPDHWEEGDPEEDPDLTPPAGLFQPVRGFGLLWRGQTSVRDRLGWAIDVEAAFTTAVQGTSRPKYNDVFMRALDGGVWKLLTYGSGWEKLP